MTRRQVNRLSALVLASGLTAAAIIWLVAEPVEPDPLLGDPLANKKHLRDLRVMGGRANVVAAEFQAWFDGLWEGEALAGTIAVLTVAGVLVFRFVTLLPPAPPSTDPLSRPQDRSHPPAPPPVHE